MRPCPELGAETFTRLPNLCEKEINPGFVLFELDNPQKSGSRIHINEINSTNLLYSLTLLDKKKSHIGIYQYGSIDGYKTRFSNENTENRNYFKLLKQYK